jgi:hypothetical protein
MSILWDDVGMGELLVYTSAPRWEMDAVNSTCIGHTNEGKLKARCSDEEVES